jgi:hypothetical protein
MNDRIYLEDIKDMDLNKFKKLSNSMKKIIVSKLSHFSDLDEYLDDLVSNAFIVLLRSGKRYESSKSSFSTYAYNRVHSSSKKMYYALKYPYSGIKSLMGKKKSEQDLFLSSPMAYISSIEDLIYDLDGNMEEKI